MEIIFATHNNNKLKEVQILMPTYVKLLSLSDIGLNDEIPETANTITENAILKTKFVRERFNLPVFADDTGLLVHALNNEPGVHTARYAGDEKNPDKNIDLLLSNLRHFDNRRARFVTVIAYSTQQEDCLFEGVCDGAITQEPQGTMGFGYDSVFMPYGFDKTFAQMSMTEKGAISHRAKALQKLIEYVSIDRKDS